jgi:hypothetical protein
MTLNYGGKKLSGFYPNVAEGRNPFSFRKHDWYSFKNIGEIESFINHIKEELSKKAYSRVSYRILKGLRFSD